MAQPNNLPVSPPMQSGVEALGANPGAGEAANADSLIRQAMKLLENALSIVGTNSDKGGGVITALRAISKFVKEDQTTNNLDLSAFKDLLSQSQNSAAQMPRMEM